MIRPRSSARLPRRSSLSARRPLPLVAAAAVILAAGGCAAAPAAREPAPAAGEEGEKSFAAATAGLERRPGLLDLHVDAEAGKVWAAIPPAVADDGTVMEVLYIEGLLTGLGSNPVGLDRGQIGETRLVRLRRVGGAVLFEERNLRYRALTDDLAERRAVEESFATSVLWAGRIEARSPDGTALVDLTPFVVRDAHGVARTLRETGQGSFELDRERSVLDPAAALAFPDNLELETILTFTGGEPGGEVRATVPTPEAVTLVQHHSLIRLPDDGYRPRAFDPRAGQFAVEFADYGAPLDERIAKRWIVRHRLYKADPGEARSPAVEPIVYYVDPSAPEPVRGALLDGARWWAEAFAAAGFEDAFRVELLPEGVHPLDVRYHVIQWVHRATRGWSYGGGVVDPRTGEMLKGHVTLGSLRVRQDRLIFEGLAGTAHTGTGRPDDPVQLALARIRQLAAHEVGHTLGLAHNFAASTYERASVMDYPAPLVVPREDGTLDFSRAYASGVGEWDVHAIRYAYADLPADGEREALEAIVQEGLDRGLLFLSDPDARPAGAAHPLANLWDNGADPVTALEQALRVRAIALEGFGEGNVRTGIPLGVLQEVVVPVYLYHRYQLEAAAKLVGGLEYHYAVRGETHPASRPVPAQRQRRALAAILGTLDPATLDLPERLVRLLLPPAYGDEPSRETFVGWSDPAFDPLAAAATAADLAVSALLQRERAARLVDLHRRDPSLPGFTEVLEILVTKAFDGEAGPPRHREIRRGVQWSVVGGLIRLASDRQASPAVRGRADAALAGLADRLEDRSHDEAGHRAALLAEIRRHLDRVRSDEEPPSAAPVAPPGQPIGQRVGWGSGAAGFGQAPGGNAGLGPAPGWAADAPDFGGCSWGLGEAR